MEFLSTLFPVPLIQHSSPPMSAAAPRILLLICLPEDSNIAGVVAVIVAGPKSDPRPICHPQQ
jgi:hypothetical protein